MSEPDEPQIMLPDQILSRELSVISQILKDETWLEGERRGCAVPPDDPTVCDHVCAIVLRIGQQLRDSLPEDGTVAAWGMGGSSGDWYVVDWAV